ncbi:MAG: hypothetical protein K2W96_06260 [Gemmataceae bacterium]|nr:hypothetical protein [Gemmataceae bacterium]
MTQTLLLALACLALAQAQAADAPGDDTQDVLYLGSGKPAVVRLRVSAGGKGVGARWEEFMGKLFAFLDGNKSGGLDRMEASRAPTPAQLSQVFAGNALAMRGGGRERPGMAMMGGPPFEQMDANRDGKVTLDELKAYYTANSCGPLLASTQGAQFAGPASDGASERLFQILDTDGDGKLSKAELEAAERVLLKYDADEDELVAAGELGFGRPGRGGRPRPAPPAMVMPKGKAAPKLPTMILVPNGEGGRRRKACADLARGLLNGLSKRKDGKASLSESGFTEEVFNSIDRNGDGRVDALELARVMTGTPAGEFSVRMGGTASGGPKRKGAKADALSLKLGSTRLTVVAGVSRVDYGESGLEDYVLGFVRSADRDKRGFVTRAQIGGEGEGRLVLNSIFSQADRNGDGRLTLDEAREYVRTMDAGRGVQLTLSLNTTGQGLFQALDANRDGALSVRELRTAWARLADMDADGDGAIALEEMPTQATLLVGNAPQARFGEEGVRRAPDRGPAWFRKMDKNGDGDVSRIEWLGDPAEFDRIDTDKDGMIGLDEAEAYDALVRKK